MNKEQDKLNNPSGYIVLEWKDGNNWRLFEKLKSEGFEVDTLSVGYLEELGRRLLKGKRYRVRPI
jgi:hypothetical protein